MVKKLGKNERSKQTVLRLMFSWKVLDPTYLLFYAHRLCMNYIISMFLLVTVADPEKNNHNNNNKNKKNSIIS